MHVWFIITIVGVVVVGKSKFHRLLLSQGCFKEESFSAVSKMFCVRFGVLDLAIILLSWKIG